MGDPPAYRLTFNPAYSPLFFVAVFRRRWNFNPDLKYPICWNTPELLLQLTFLNSKNDKSSALMFGSKFVVHSESWLLYEYNALLFFAVEPNLFQSFLRNPIRGRPPSKDPLRIGVLNSPSTVDWEGAVLLGVSLYNDWISEEDKA